MASINTGSQLKIQEKEYLDFLIPILIYTTYLITIVDDGKRFAIEEA
jgi:hypothetical protein